MQAASDVYSPISGEVVESNQGLADEPGKVCTCCLCSIVPWRRTLMPSFSCGAANKDSRRVAACCLLGIACQWASCDLQHMYECDCHTCLQVTNAHCS